MLCISTVSSAPTQAPFNKTYFGEGDTVPFEAFLVICGTGLLFFMLAAFSGYSYWGGPTMVFGLIGTLFLTVAAYAAPITGFYTYISNTTTNATNTVTPMVWLIMQPWMMWLLWGLALVSFILFVFGILILLREKAHEDEMDWV